jgi:hypothetical protein
MLRVHPEVGAAVTDEHVEFLETAWIQETLEALPCREFSFLVLGIDALLSATELRSTPAFYEFVDSVLLYAHGIWIYIYSFKYMKKS